jgi:hypothetical protein
MCVPEAFQRHSAAGAKMLFERDRRSGKIEIRNARKRGVLPLQILFSWVLVREVRALLQQLRLLLMKSC